ncbi:hypothetical protein ACMZOO_02785 [Catenovulum sp. SX2]|uniref:hypothetical protein n=1 Tax=Catenovulum sp. SX2 TaxID=3398614 RepID=UPI003F87D979
MKFIILLFTLISFASAANETEISVGLGYPFGSPTLGVQYAAKIDIFKVYASLGLVGYSTGLELAVSKNKKHSLGVTWGSELLSSDEGFGFITYSYHFNSFTSKGFLAGLGVGYTREEVGFENESGNWNGTGEIDTLPTLSLILGYKF